MRTRREPLRYADLAPYVALAVATMLALQCLRVLFPVAYTYREASGLTSAALVLLAVFLAPVAAIPLVGTLGPRRGLVTAAVVLGASRLWLQHGGKITVSEAALAAGAGLATVTAALVVTVPGRPRDRVVLALVAGLALDTMIRGAFSTWDPVWQGGAVPWLVAVVPVAVLVATAASCRSPSPRALTPEAVNATGRFAVVAGPFLALQVLFLQSPAFVASSGGVALATAVAVVLVGDALAIGSAVLVSTRAAGGWVVAGAAGAGLVTISGILPAVSGAVLVALLWAGQVLAAALVSRVLEPGSAPRHPRGVPVALGTVAGWLAFGLTIFLYQLHYDRPLPFTNRWLPVVAATIVAFGAVAVAWRADPRPTRAADVRRGGRAPALLAAAVVVAAVAVSGGLAAGEPDLTPARTRPDTLRVVTYNPHEAVTRAGRLDPAAVAAALQRLRPDVVVLEEAGRGWPLSSSIDLAEWLKRRLGMPYVWVPAADHQFGNVLLSRVPVLSTRRIDLPQGDGTMKRSAVIARVGPVHGTDVTVVGTHLQNGSTPARKATRVAELEVLLHALGPVRDVVLVGDLNSDPGSRELETLLAAGFTTTQPTEKCVLETSNAHCVDWILVRPGLDESPVRTLPVDTFDHRPLVATVRPR